MASKPQVAAFINFFLTNVNEEVIGVGYFPASDEALDSAKQNWLTAMPVSNLCEATGRVGVCCLYGKGVYHPPPCSVRNRNCVREE